MRDLGFTLDRELTFTLHINLLSRDCFYQLRQLRTVARSLTASAASTLVHAFVTSRLDYCCSLYAGLPAVRLGCLDGIMRSAARLIGRIPKYGHVSGYMLDVLHWLPSEQRIAYRTAALVWRCLLGFAPAYLRELCCPVLSARGSRSLRSSEQGLLLVPFARTSTMQNRAFSVGAPRPGVASLWSFALFLGPSLPRSLLTLKLFFLAVLESGAPLSSFLEGALYKCSV